MKNTYSVFVAFAGTKEQQIEQINNAHQFYVRQTLKNIEKDVSQDSINFMLKFLEIEPRIYKEMRKSELSRRRIIKRIEEDK